MSEKWKQILKSGRATYLLIGCAVLIAAMIILIPENTASEDTDPIIPESRSAETYTEDLSNRIAQMVSAITGESNPHVTITLQSMGEIKYATEDRQSARSEQEYTGDNLNKTQTDGDSETSYILVKSADGSQKPLIISQTEPEIKGVVIVSEWGNNIQMREKITTAVKTALDLSATQVCVTGGSEYT